MEEEMRAAERESLKNKKYLHVQSKLHENTECREMANTRRGKESKIFHPLKSDSIKSKKEKQMVLSFNTYYAKSNRNSPFTKTSPNSYLQTNMSSRDNSVISPKLKNFPSSISKFNLKSNNLTFAMSYANSNFSDKKGNSKESEKNIRKQNYEFINEHFSVKLKTNKRKPAKSTLNTACTSENENTMPSLPKLVKYSLKKFSSSKEKKSYTKNFKNNLDFFSKSDFYYK
jgi:hypothetical protein